MELMPLGSLFSYIRKNQEAIPWKDRHQLMMDLCAGMEFLHSGKFADGSAKQVIFHQDIKSSNVLLKFEDNKPRAKITDFGLSLARKDRKSSNEHIQGSQQVNHRGGTKGYLAPELHLSHCKFNKKGDVFAAGVVFLELLTLELPTELYDDCWPHIVDEKALPVKMKEALCQSLSEDQSKRTSFTEIRMVLQGVGDEICMIYHPRFSVSK
jgi:serine/threonine protein kinase